MEKNVKMRGRINYINMRRRTENSNALIVEKGRGGRGNTKTRRRIKN